MQKGVILRPKTRFCSKIRQKINFILRFFMKQIVFFTKEYWQNCYLSFFCNNSAKIKRFTTLRRCFEIFLYFVVQFVEKSRWHRKILKQFLISFLVGPGTFVVALREVVPNWVLCKKRIIFYEKLGFAVEFFEKLCLYFVSLWKQIVYVTKVYWKESYISFCL